MSVRARVRACVRVSACVCGCVLISALLVSNCPAVDMVGSGFCGHRYRAPLVSDGIVRLPLHEAQHHGWIEEVC